MGTTKKIVTDQLAALRTWAQRLTDAVNADPGFKAMGDGDELANDSPLWPLFAAAASDKVFLKFIDMAGRSDDRTSIAFDDFLASMSRSVVKTQQALDAESARYLAATADKGHVLPSVFRLPKLSAQVRFAIETERTDGLNLIFYKRDEKTTSRNEQAIDFDIVSVPAPPDARASALAVSPRLDLVLDPFERSPLVDTIRKLPPTGTNAPLVQAAAAAPEQLVLLALMPEEKMHRYLVMYADPQGAGKSVGTWRLTLPEGADAVLETVYPMNRKNADNEELLRDVVLAVAARQKTFLAG